MSELAHVALGLFAALAPFGALRTFAVLAAEDRPRRLTLASSFLSFGLALIGVAVIVSDPFLAWLEVSPENFQVAAGVVMLPLALRLLWSGQSTGSDELEGRHLFWLTAVLVPSPVVFVAAVGYSARFDGGTVILASLVVLALTALIFAAGSRLPRSLGATGMSVLGRGSGALLVVVAAELIVEGVQSV